MWDEIRKVYPPPSSSAAPLGKTHSTNENRIFVTSDKIQLFAVFKLLPTCQREFLKEMLQTSVFG